MNPPTPPPRRETTTPTPRTDSEAGDGWSGDAICVSADFARTLERELAEACRERDEAVRDAGFKAHQDLQFAVVPESKNPTLWRYLETAYAKKISFHRIGVNRMPDGGYHFYIHPEGVSGDTQDYLIWPDPFNWNDVLVNRLDSPAPDVEGFKRALHAAMQPRSEPGATGEREG